MKSIHQWLDEYGESHQNKTNKIIHWICVPTIFITILGLIASIPAQGLKELAPDYLTYYTNWGSLILMFVLIFYLVHSFKLFIGMLIWSMFCIWFVEVMRSWPSPLWLSSIILFALAWVGQFYGHHVEGKKPSFLKDIQFLLIGPAWLMSFIYKSLGIRY